MRNRPFWWIVLGVFLLIDVYVFYVTRSLFNAHSGRNRTVYTIGYWSVSIIALLGLFLLPQLQLKVESKLMRSVIFALVFALFLAKIVAAVFFFVDDIRRFFQWGVYKFSPYDKETSNGAGAGNAAISRSSFLTWLGIVAGGGVFSTFVYGFTNKYRYYVNNVRLNFDTLPAEFKGLKIAHISDIHTGSFGNQKAVSKGVDLILKQKPDLIVFTGDLVNNKSDEMVEAYQNIFSRLKAPMGVYSILGNHDYGDYAEWDTAAAKAANLEALKNIHAAMGWRLLLDEHVPLQKEGAFIGLMGVQNISGKSRFHSYGNLEKAMKGAENYPFRILMSHDPSHWDMEVNTKYTNIDLTLSGHTHGMQFGVEIPGFRWSPVQYIYKQWAGLYEQEKQKLYINRGYGFIGYPGRVGILPEITLIELT